MHVIFLLQKSISNVMQMHTGGETPAEKMRPYISKTIYMSVAHYSPVLNVIAARLWMNSWNNKIHWATVTASCSYFMSALPPLCPSLAPETGDVVEEGGETRKKWKSHQLSWMYSQYRRCEEITQHPTTTASKPPSQTQEAQANFALQMIARQLEYL